MRPNGEPPVCYTTDITLLLHDQKFIIIDQHLKQTRPTRDLGSALRKRGGDPSVQTGPFGSAFGGYTVSCCILYAGPAQPWYYKGVLFPTRAELTALVHFTEISPNQCHTEEATPRRDLHAFGKSLIQCIT